MKRIFLLLLFVLPMFSFVSIHKFYVSVTEIQYRPEQKAVQVLTRVFTDDFEDVLKARYGNDLFLAKEAEHEQIEGYINRYLSQKLQVTVNGKKLELEYLGKEYENDMLLLYLEAKKVADLKQIEVSSSILFDGFPEQKNIVHVEVNDQTKSLLLVAGKPEGSLSF